MTPPDVLRAMGEVQPGRLITDMKIRSGSGRAIKGLRLGLLPEDSPLAGDNTHTVAATNTTVDPPTRVDVVAVLKEIEASSERCVKKEEVIFAARNATGENPAVLRQVLNSAGAEFQIGDFVIDPKATDLPPATLDQVGFQDMGDGSGRHHFPVYEAAA